MKQLEGYSIYSESKILPLRHIHIFVIVILKFSLGWVSFSSYVNFPNICRTITNLHSEKPPNREKEQEIERITIQTYCNTIFVYYIIAYIFGPTAQPTLTNRLSEFLVTQPTLSTLPNNNECLENACLIGNDACFWNLMKSCPFPWLSCLWTLMMIR